jgi:hypothetical protein
VELQFCNLSDEAVLLVQGAKRGANTGSRPTTSGDLGRRLSQLNAILGHNRRLPDIVQMRLVSGRSSLLVTGLARQCLARQPLSN